MTTAVHTPAPNGLKTFLEKNSAAIKDVAIGTLTPDRMSRLVCAAASRDPKLSECTPLSILRSMVQCASMGLEPFDGRSLVHIVPRWNSKAKAMEATVLIDFRGLIHLATQDGKVRNVEARVVYEKDEFTVEYGDAPRLTHRPSWAKDRGDIVAFYAVAFMPDGSTTFEVMPLHEVEAIRDRSKDKDGFSPWKTDFSEMGRKTVVRRLSKYLPKSMPMAKALEIQAKTEAGEYHDIEAEVIRPGDAPTLEGPKTETDGDGNQVFVWTQEHKEAFFGAKDTFFDLATQAGWTEEQINETLSRYDGQRADGEDPERVLNRMAARTQEIQHELKRGAK